MKIGIVDLDVSHPDKWIPIERELGHEVVGIWDGGSVHPPEYVKKFAADRNVPRVLDRIDQLVEICDCAIVHGCDWDTHVDKARPFVEAGKAVLLDKPMAGNLRDLRQLQQWATQGARVAGGSSLRFTIEVAQWRAVPAEQRGEPHTVFCGCGTDEFNYAIHAYSLLSSILGPGIVRVQHLGQGGQRHLKLKWRDGRTGFLAIGAPAGGRGLPFHATIVTQKGVQQFNVDSSRIYRCLLEATLPYLAGQVERPPIPMDELIEPELAAVAARQSWMHGDKPVAISDIDSGDPGYDGQAFAVEYRAARYPQAAVPAR